MSEGDAGQIRGGDWAVYFGLLTATFVGVLALTGSVAAALWATCGGVAAATKAAQMTTRAYRAQRGADG